MIRLRYLVGCTRVAGAIVTLRITGCASSGASRRAVEPVYVFEPLSAQELAAVQYPNLREEMLFRVKQDQLARTGQDPTRGDREDVLVQREMEFRSCWVSFIREAVPRQFTAGMLAAAPRPACRRQGDLSP